MTICDLGRYPTLACADERMISGTVKAPGVDYLRLATAMPASPSWGLFTGSGACAEGHPSRLTGRNQPSGKEREPGARGPRPPGATAGNPGTARR